MEAKRIFVILLLALSIFMSAPKAYFNITYTTTTVSLSNSTTAHVVETLDLYVSNSSMSQYNQDRQAVNLTLSGWQQVIGTGSLVEHVFNPKSSIYNFTFLPGPLTSSGNGAYAILTMSYYAHNVTSVEAIQPRQFEYTFNNSVFNFQHTASGQSLFSNSKLVLLIPNSSSVNVVYPAPDFPTPNSYGQYNGTMFIWSGGEPLQKFTFTYVVYETPQQEVLKYFINFYNSNSRAIFVMIILFFAVLLVYIYIRVFQ